MRLYPAVDLRWAVRPDEDRVERLLADLDDEHPTAIEDRGDTLRVFFASHALRGRAAVRAIAFDALVECEPVDVPDEDWAARSQAALGPVRIGRIVVTPPAHADDARAGASRDDVIVVIQPSLGFGTGHHASTRLCLRLLQEIDVAGRRVLDAGTGSGVLALTAWRLGAREVVAADSDADAIASARDNLALNGATAAIRLEAADFAEPPAMPAPPFDLVVGNLTGAFLVRHAASLAALAAPGGSLILSGILADEESDVARAFLAAGRTVATRLDEEQWLALHLQ